MPTRHFLFLFFLVVIMAACGGQDIPGAAPATAASEAAEPSEDASAVEQPTEQPANVTTSGTISRDEIWRDEIHITGDILVSPGVTLTIEPGTTVYIASFSDDNHAFGPAYTDDFIQSFGDPTGTNEWFENAITIEGHIVAEGTPSAPITFTTEDDSESTAQWDGLVMDGGSLKHCLVENAHIGVNIQGPSVEVAHCTVLNVLWVAIDLHAPNAWVHHNMAYGGGHQTIGVFSDNGLIENNILREGSQGISGEGGLGTVIRNNVFLDNAQGINVGSGTEQMKVVNNTIVQVAGPPDGWYFQGNLIYPSTVSAPFGIGLFKENYSGAIVNNIIVGYRQGLVIGVHPGEEAQIGHNLVWGAATVDSVAARVPAPNSLAADPLFVDPENEDFTLQPGSPAIDAGRPEILDADGSISDLGAYGGPMGEW